MPYYRWTGVTIEGKMKKGAQAALSCQALELILLDQNIATISIKKVQLIFTKQPSQKIRAQLYERILILLRAGIRVPEALSIAAVHYKDYPTLQEFLYQTASDTKEGIPLSTCIKKSPLFSEIEHTVLQAGEQGNHLSEAVNFISHVLGQKAVYNQKLRSALTTPLLIGIITLGLFIGIIVFLIPQFASFLQTSNQPINPTIATLIKIRSFIVNPLWLACITTGLLCGLIGVKKIARIKKVNSCLSMIKRQIPIYRSMRTYSFLISFFHTLYLMLGSGQTIEQSISLIHAGTICEEQEPIIQEICEKVRTGKPLSTILREYPNQFELEDAFLMHTGELAGSTHQATKIIYEKYCKKADFIMEKIHHYAQPTAIIILGIFIGSMVIGIYKPILSIALRI